MNDLEQIEAIIAKNLTITDQRLMDGVIGAVMDAVAAEREEKGRQIAFLKDAHDAIRELAYKTGAQEEREACAKVCEEFDCENPYIGQGRACAFEIRERQKA
jgi:hypothetical protein